MTMSQWLKSQPSISSTPSSRGLKSSYDQVWLGSKDADELNGRDWRNGDDREAREWRSSDHFCGGGAGDCPEEKEEEEGEIAARERQIRLRVR